MEVHGRRSWFLCSVSGLNYHKLYNIIHFIYIQVNTGPLYVDELCTFSVACTKTNYTIPEHAGDHLCKSVGRGIISIEENIDIQRSEVTILIA